MKPLIRGWELQPPMGGWNITYEHGGQEWVLMGRPYQIVQQIASIQQKNEVYEGDEKIWEFCNNIWCERDPKRCVKGKMPVMSQNPAVTFGHALLSLVKNGMKPVEQELALRRAKICATTCKGKLNLKLTKCNSCLQGVARITKMLIGTRSTIYDKQLNQCAVCKCDLKQKIHYPLNEGDKNVYPDYCWVTKERGTPDE